MIFALLPIASALSEGQILTQEQVNNFPVDNYNTINELVGLLECQKYDGFKTLWKHEEWYVKPFDCFQIDKIQGISAYIIKRKTYFPRFQIAQYRECVNEILDQNIPVADRQEICGEYLTDNMRDYGRNKIWKIKQEIVDYQDEADSGTDFDGDFGGDLF